MLVDALGVEVYVRDTGQGEPVLFLHGNPDTSDIWNEVIDRLRDQHRCIAIDLPGFGRTKAPRDFDYAFENLGRFVDAVVERIGIGEPLNLIAHDFGGAFAMAGLQCTGEKYAGSSSSTTRFSLQATDGTTGPEYGELQCSES